MNSTSSPNVVLSIISKVDRTNQAKKLCYLPQQLCLKGKNKINKQTKNTLASMKKIG